MDAYKKIVGEQGILAKIASFIPGFGGYLERETRRNADKLEREFLAKQLSFHKQKLGDLTLELTNAMKLDLIGPMDNASNKLEKIMDRIRYADYGYAGFFDTVKINEAELEKMYEFDLTLLEYSKSIEETLNAIEQGIDNEEDDKDISKSIKYFNKLLTDFDGKFNEREKVIMEVKK